MDGIDSTSIDRFVDAPGAFYFDQKEKLTNKQRERERVMNIPTERKLMDRAKRKEWTSREAN